MNTLYACVVEASWRQWACPLNVYVCVCVGVWKEKESQCLRLYADDVSLLSAHFKTHTLGNNP